MWVGESIVPVSRGYGGVQPGATPRGPESRSVQPALRPGPRGSLFVTGPKGGRKTPHRGRPGDPLATFTCDGRLAQAPTSPPAWPRIIGPRLFWRSCVPAFLKDLGESGRGTMFSLTARVSQPMGKSQTPRAGRPLLFSPVRGGETQGTGVRPVSGNSVSTLQGAVHLISGNWVSPSQGAAGRPLGKDREGLACRGP